VAAVAAMPCRGGSRYGWLAANGAGTVSRVQLKITLAAVPTRAFTARTAASVCATHI